MKYPYSMHYLAASAVPSETAASIHVVRMANALGGLTREVTLFAKRGEGRSIEKFYGLERPLATRTVEFKGRKDLLNYLRVLRDSAAPDLAYGRYAYAVAYMAGKGVPFMYEVHLPATGIKRRVEDWLFRQRNLVGLVAITEALAGFYRQRYPWLAERTLVLPDAADDPGPCVAPRIAGKLKVAYVGSWFEGRGVELIVELAHSLPHIDFVAAGGGHETLVERGLSVPDNLSCLGYVPPAEVDHVLRGADVLLAPYARAIRVAGNRGDSSAWCSPMKLFEYMAHGKTIVCADLPVLHEVLEHERNCLLAEPEDAPDWRKTLERLNADRSLAQQVGAAARAQFCARHTWRLRAEQALEFAASRLA